MNILYANDQPGVYPDSYYTAKAQFLDPFPAVEGELRADVCIVGAGFSGLSAALHLAQRGFDVALVDAHRVGWGASGRNGGHVGTGQRVDQQELTELVGSDDARKLWQISEDAKALVTALIKDLNIECDYQRGNIHANHKKRFEAHSRSYVDFMHSEYGYEDIRFVPQDEMRTLLATTAYYDGDYDTGCFHLNPMDFVLGLARACAAAGVRIYERSEVTEIVEGDTILLKTPQGEIKAKHVILGANGYLGRLNRRASNRVIPINNYIVTTEPLSEEVATSLIANGASVSDSKFVINYFRLTDDRRLLFGGKSVV